MGDRWREGVVGSQNTLNEMLRMHLEMGEGEEECGGREVVSGEVVRRNIREPLFYGGPHPDTPASRPRSCANCLSLF